MNKTTETKRTIYSPSEFAKKTLIYLQEVGETKTLVKHTSSRNRLDSFLFFIVLEGNGTLTYNNTEHQLSKGSCVIIDCNLKYSHTSDNWTIKWIHMYGNNIADIYQKYILRNGHNAFKSNNFNEYISLINNIDTLANSNNYIKDINIYNELVTLLSLLMSETLYTNSNRKHLYDIQVIKEYLDNHYLESITLNELSSIFYINKFYLTRLFKETYGITINNYINTKKITLSKELLRFSNLSIEDISIKCGIDDTNYFSRLFKKIEGITPNEYKKKW